MMDEMGDKLNPKMTFENFADVCGVDVRFKALTDEERRGLFAEKVISYDPNLPRSIACHFA
jgi:hypothetical protein